MVVFVGSYGVKASEKTNQKNKETNSKIVVYEIIHVTEMCVYMMFC